MAFSIRGIFKGIFQKRVLIPLLIVVVAGGGGWYYYAKTHPAATVSYVQAAVQQGNLQVTSSGSGQVSSSNAISLQPLASGTVTSVPVTEGEQVSAGQLIAQIDDTDALRTVRDAEASVANAKLSLQKLQEPPDALTILQDQDAITQAQQDLTNSQNNLSTGYSSGYDSVSNAFLALPDVITGLDNIMTGKTSDTQQYYIDEYGDSVSSLSDTISTQTLTFKNKAIASYTKAEAEYNQNVNDYKASTRSEDPSQTTTLINETYQTTLDVAQAVKDTNDFLNFVDQTLTYYNKKLPTNLATDEASFQTYTGTCNTQLSNLLNAQNTIVNAQQSIASDQQSIQEKTDTLTQLQAGPDPLDIQSSQLSITQAENSLADDEAALANYSVRAPIAGTIASIQAKVGNSVPSTVATLLAPNLIASITLNEVDIVNIKVGQPASMTFDALPGVKATGSVTQLDPLGTVSQGVVTYTVQVTLANPDPRIKPGMNVTTAIVTQEHDNVLMVSSSAVQTARGGSYVQTLDATTNKPVNVPVQVGLSNATMTEITSGLTAGEKIIVRTVTSTPKAATATSSTSLIPGLGGTTRVGGGAGGFTGGGGGFGGGAGGAGAARPAAGG